MARFKANAILVRDLENLTIIFWDKDSIYMYPKNYRFGTIFHKWFVPRGNGKDWYDFRRWMLRTKNITELKCYEMAATYDIVATHTDRKLNLEGRKVNYRK